MRALLILLAFTLTGAVQAQQAPQPKEDPYLARFQELDQNKDGYVTIGEWPLKPDSFAVVDRDKDGRLGKAELLLPNRLQRDWDPPPPPAPRRPELDRRAPAPRPDPEDAWGSHVTIRDLRLLRDLDLDRDNRLNRREWTGSAGRFHRLDTNQDGVLSPRELSRN
jgi:EF hand